jgi:hypothetical protein
VSAFAHSFLCCCFVIRRCSLLVPVLTVFCVLCAGDRDIRSSVLRCPQMACCEHIRCKALPPFSRLMMCPPPVGAPMVRLLTVASCRPTLKWCADSAHCQGITWHSREAAPSRWLQLTVALLLSRTGLCLPICPIARALFRR